MVSISPKERKKYLIGNWKSNKTKSQVSAFFQEFAQKFKSIGNKKPEGLELIVCPVFIHLEESYKQIIDLKLPILLGAQDISPFEMGAFTGEVTGSQLKEYVSFCIIGHSERRKYFAEDDALLVKKAALAKREGIEVIYCVPDSLTSIPKDVKIVAYEPVFAIGTGTPDTPDNAQKVIKEIKSKNNISLVLYGGSINKDNISKYFEKEDIDGVLVGTSSLDPDSFMQMMLNAAL